MRYLLMFAAILLIACAEKHTAGGYYSTTTKDTTAYIGRMKYHDFEHDTTFKDTIFVIRIDQDSLRFWFSDFIVGYSENFKCKRIYEQYSIDKKEIFETSIKNKYIAQFLRFSFYKGNKLIMGEKFDQYRHGLLSEHQVYNFEGEKYSHIYH
jgi:hypothetical protein